MSRVSRTWRAGLPPVIALKDHEAVVLILTLDRHLTWEQKRQWERFYGELYTGEARYVASFDAYCPSKIQLKRTYSQEPWKPIAVFALCPPGMKEEKRLLVPLAFEKWKVALRFEDVCWQEIGRD
jgi:hypothetical protein